MKKTQPLNEQHFVKSINYYIDHLQIELNHDRLDLIRHILDPLCALANGFVVDCQCGTRYEGNHKKFKTNSFASPDANKPSQNKKIILEHVIPLAEVEAIILAESAREKYKTPEGRKKLLHRVVELIIPCAITEPENNKLNTLGYKNTMPKDAVLKKNYWARYNEADIKPIILNKPPRWKEATSIIMKLNDKLELPT